MRRHWTWVLCFLMVAMSSSAQIGIFTDSMDIGEPNQVGEVNLDGDVYQVFGGGSTIGRASFTDQFFFVYREISGSFSIECDPFPVSLDGEGGLMIRQDLETDSVQASWLRVSDNVPGGNTNAAYGTMFPHIRSLKGGASIVDGDIEGGFTDSNIGPVRLERIGNSINFYSMNNDGDWVWQREEVTPMTDPVYVGLALTANGADLLAEFEFNDVALEEYPMWVGRSIPIDEWNAGETIQVVVTANSSESVDAVVNEIVPALCNFSNVSVSNGDFEVDAEEGAINWTLNGFSGEATLTYDLTLADRQSGSWQGTFSDGINRTGWIGGDTLLPKNPVWGEISEPIPVPPDEITLIQAEVGNPPEEEGPYIGLGVDPRTHSGVTAINMSGGASRWIEIPIMIEESGRYYFFGNPRGEDGNSDSWHFEVDIDPAGDDTTRWNVNGSDAFAVEWVTREAGQEDGEGARPFDLDAGEHFIRIANREDSASIDWIAVTMDDSLGIGAYDEITGEIFDPLTELEGLTELGIFDGHQDIVQQDNPGNLGAEGGAGYDPVKEEYVVVGSGNDIWGNADNFHFLYKEISGDFSIQSTIKADAGTSTNDWVKATLMARETLESESANAAVLQRPDGLFNVQWRLAFLDSSASTPGEQRPTLPNGTTQIRLERQGDIFLGSYKAATDDDFTVLQEIEVFMEDPIYVGLGVTSHQIGSLSIGYYTDVELIVDGVPVPVENWSLY